MLINLKTNKNFTIAFNKLVEKYGEKFKILNGFHDSQMNYSDFIDSFVDNNVADVTIDANANANNKDIRSLLTEKDKSHNKLFAANKIFYELQKKYGLNTAREWLETEYNGGFYLHDFSSATFYSYCYAYDLTRLAKEGLFFLKNYNAKPPKHLTTYFDDVIEYISYMTNRSSGACGLPNVLIWSYYFWKKDCEEGYYIKDKDYYLKQSFQKFIYRLNQPFMRIDQTAFVNVSIFDREYLISLFGGVEYPDGSLVIDNIEEIIEHQKIFMEVVSEIRTENMFTFPVISYSLLYKDNKFVDEDFARWCSNHNRLWNDSNFFISGDVGTLSNCPMSGDTKIFYYSERYKKYMIGEIKEIYNNKKQDDERVIKTLANGKEINCKINKFNIPVEYKITLANGAVIKTTSNHLNKVYGKDYMQSKDLTTDDYLPYGMNLFKTNDNLSYEEGLLIGMFLGDGSYCNSTEIAYSLNKNKKRELIDFLYEYCPTKFGATISETVCYSSISNKPSCVNVKVNSSYLKGLIQTFVKGDNALSKALDSKVFTQSIEFRKGVIDGLYKTDGGNSNRIYTASIGMRDSIVSLLATLGMVASINEDTRDGRLSDKPCYTIRYYTPSNRKKLRDVYIIEDEYMWIKIKDIKKLNPSKERGVSYCLEVLDDVEPIFTLANGIITHNCRLLSDTNKLSAFINSIGGTALSIGSVKVNTINLMRIAYETNKDENKYLELLRQRIELCCKVLDTVRHIIKRNVEKGLLPNYQDGGIEMEKQYNTVGILGLYEVIEYFGFIKEDEFGNKSYTEEGIEFASKIFETLNDVKDNFTNEYSMNVESVPAERCAVILCAKDNELYNKDNEEGKFIYSNQWIPLSEKCTIQEKLKLSSILDAKCSGGSIAHINLDSNFPNDEVAWNMLNKIAQAGVIYFAFNTKINECKNHHGFVGTNTCPNCGEGVYDTYCRIVGYLVPTRNYSKDRKKEFTLRDWYKYSDLGL